MRTLISLLVIVYLVGVGVVLAPTIRMDWGTATTSQFVASIINEMPRALAWPVELYRRTVERG
jgi:hypothetical protein